MTHFWWFESQVELLDSCGTESPGPVVLLQRSKRDQRISLRVAWNTADGVIQRQADFNILIRWIDDIESFISTHRGHLSPYVPMKLFTLSWRDFESKAFGEPYPILSIWHYGRDIEMFFKLEYRGRMTIEQVEKWAQRVRAFVERVRPQFEETT